MLKLCVFVPIYSILEKIASPGLDILDTPFNFTSGLKLSYSNRKFCVIWKYMEIYCGKMLYCWHESGLGILVAAGIMDDDNESE